MKTKDAYYFSHDSNARNDVKMVRLRRKQGLAGVGIFWCIIEMLREANGFMLPLDTIDDIAYDLKATVEDVTDVVRNYKLFELTETHFYSSRLIRSMEEYEALSEKRRRAGILGAQAMLKQRASNAQAKGSHTLGIKGNKSKGNKSKGKDNTPLPPKGDSAAHGSNIEKAVDEGSRDWRADFEWFWNAYNRKLDRAKCERKFQKLSNADMAAIREHVPKYVQATPEVQYRKHPSTYLTNKCWRDEDLPGVTEEQTIFSKPKIVV